MTTLPPVSISYGTPGTEGPTGVVAGTGLIYKCQLEAQKFDTDLINQFPQIASDASNFLVRDLDLLDMRAYADTNFGFSSTVGLNAYVGLPNDCEVMRWLQVFKPVLATPSNDGTDQLSGNGTQLVRVDESFLLSWASNRSSTGFPKYWAVLGAGQYQNYPTGQILVAPTPDQSYNIRLGYTARPAPIAPDNQTTYLSTWYPDLLFGACMIRVCQFTRNMEQMQAYTPLFQASLTDARGLEKRRKGQEWSDFSQTEPPETQRPQ